MAVSFTLPYVLLSCFYLTFFFIELFWGFFSHQIVLQNTECFSSLQKLKMHYRRDHLPQFALKCILFIATENKTHECINHKESK